MGKICSNCGFEIVDDKFNFCPNCGSEIIEEQPPKEKYKFCPVCGKKLKIDTKVCPNCGINFEGRFRKIANKYSNKKSINKILDLGAYTSLKLDGNVISNRLIRKGWEHDDPAFLTVYDSISEEYLKKLFLLERNKIVVGGSDILGNVKFISPTEKMSYKEGVKFYEQLLENLISELNEAKQDENFDKDDYYKKKYKESRIEMFANYPL